MRRAKALLKAMGIGRLRASVTVTMVCDVDPSTSDRGDAVVRATLLGTMTERARVGLRPTNTLTREPQAMAGLAASLDSLTDELWSVVQQYVDGYVLYEHVQNQGENPRRMQALGLADYALRRVALAANAADWIARIEAWAEAGVRHIWFGPGHHYLDRQIRDMTLFRDEIAPRFS